MKNAKEQRAEVIAHAQLPLEHPEEIPRAAAQHTGGVVQDKRRTGARAAKASDRENAEEHRKHEHDNPVDQPINV